MFADAFCSKNHLQEFTLFQDSCTFYRLTWLHKLRLIFLSPCIFAASSVVTIFCAFILLCQLFIFFSTFWCLQPVWLGCEINQTRHGNCLFLLACFTSTCARSSRTCHRRVFFLWRNTYGCPSSIPSLLEWLLGWCSHKTLGGICVLCPPTLSADTVND